MNDKSHPIGREPACIYDDDYLRLMQVGHYRYAERKGKDSVAFVLVDDSRWRNGRSYGLIHEFKPPIRSWLTTAYGGSLDCHRPLNRIVQQEVEEEAGIRVTLDGIVHIGSYFVSTQMNQFCHLFVVHANAPYLMGTQKEGWTAEDKKDDLERLSTPVWLSAEDALMSPCWKAQVIIRRHLEWLERARQQQGVRNHGE